MTNLYDRLATENNFTPFLFNPTEKPYSLSVHQVCKRRITEQSNQIDPRGMSYTILISKSHIFFLIINIFMFNFYSVCLLVMHSFVLMLMLVHLGFYIPSTVEYVN